MEDAQMFVQTQLVHLFARVQSDIYCNPINELVKVKI